MEVFIASRLTADNKVYPSEIIIDKDGVTLKIPGLFSGNEKTIPFKRISSVNTISPLIGYSTINIETNGDGSIKAYGFRKSEVRRIKELILAKINTA